jgi:CDP-diacylglycerol--glycerol-3-phosphate 3-phosphatidyltransferase
MAKILSVSVKAGTARLLDPLSRALLRIAVTPNMVTVFGTAGVGVGAIGFATRGGISLVWAVVIVTLMALTDVMDGSMARIRGSSGRFGALLDSTMDRLADAMVFGSLAYLYRHETPTLIAALLCLVTGQLVSYVKARAEGLGLDASKGLVERAERLILTGVGGLLTGFGVGWGLPVALWLLAVGSVVTVGQRMWQAARSAAGTP